MSTVFPVLAGAVGIGTVGHLENAVTFSPQQLVIDNEIIRAVKRMLKPIEVNEETLSLDVIRSVGRSSYLEEQSTLEHFREELFLSDLFETVPWESARTENRAMEVRAHERATEIWSQNPEPIIDSVQIKAIEQVMSKARRALLE